MPALFKRFYTLPRVIKEEKKNEEEVGSLESRERARSGNLKLKEGGNDSLDSDCPIFQGRRKSLGGAFLFFLREVGSKNTFLV